MVRRRAVGCGDRGRIAPAAQAYRFRSGPGRNVWAASQVDTDESIRILSRLGFTVVEHGDILHVTPPSWRRDIDGPADLVEEIVRIHGLDRRAVGAAGRAIAPWPSRC